MPDFSPPPAGRLEFSDIPAEGIVLGNLLAAGKAEADWVSSCFAQLRLDDFYDPRNMSVFAALKAMYDEGSFIDPTGVAARLQVSGDLIRIGGATYLHDLIASVPLPGHPYPHIGLVLTESARRRASVSLTRAQTRLATCSTREDVLLAMDEELAPLMDALAPTEDSEAQTVKESIIAALERADPANPLPEGGEPLMTGLVDLDEITSGFRPGQLVVVGGRPGSGKSTLMLDIARHVAMRSGMYVMVFSLEMGNDELGDRAAAAELGVDLERIRTRSMVDTDWLRARNRLPNVFKEGDNLLLVQSPALDLGRLRALIRRYGRKRQPKLVVIDYLQLMRAPRAESREQEVASLSRGLKIMSRTIPGGATFLVGSQLNRSLENRVDKRPGLSDLRESGSVEQDSDVVLLMHRPSVYDESEDPYLSEVYVAKNRNGRTGKAGLFANLPQAHHSNLVRLD